MRKTHLGIKKRGVPRIRNAGYPATPIFGVQTPPKKRLRNVVSYGVGVGEDPESLLKNVS